MKPVRSALALLLLLAVACGPKEQTGMRTGVATAKTPRPLSHVKVGHRALMLYAPIFLAQSEGWFREEGIELEMVSLDSSSAMMAAASGQLDVFSTQIRSGLFNLMIRGVQVQVVADAGYSRPGGCTSEAFAAPVQTADRILKNKSYRGETFALIRGGVTEYLIDRLLEREGLTQDDIKFSQIPQNNNTWLGNQLNAVHFAADPILSQGIRAGRTRMLTPIQDVDPIHQYGLLVYGKRLIHDDPDLGRRFMRAYLRGAARLQEGKSERNLAVLTKETRVPVDVLEQSCWLPFAVDGKVDPAAVQPFLEWAEKKKYLDAGVPASKWWNGSFAEAAARELGTPAP